MAAQWDNPRKIVERIYIEGLLSLETPAHLGCGDAEGLLDMPLMRDAYSGGFLLTGSTLTGALRGYLVGLGPNDKARADELFGTVTNGESLESWLVVEDSVSESAQIETRDGVTISGVSGTAVDQAKYDIELLCAGTIFQIGFELLVPLGNGPMLLETLATALVALEQGQISLGKRKRRGFGRCQVTGWKVWRFPVNTGEGMLRWLENWPLPADQPDQKGRGIDQLLLNRTLPVAQQADTCTLKAVFTLESPLLIRSTPEVKWVKESGKVEETPDMVHLHSWRPEGSRPIVSGTSLAGALRARTVRICNVVGRDGNAYADSLFGNRKPDKHDSEDASPDRNEDLAPDKKQKWTASRLWVEETVIRGPVEDDLIQTRVMIDRFTGGAHSGALFSEQPVFPLAGNRLDVNLRLQLKKGEDGLSDQTGDIGLLLLLLKDLWTGDLPIGGESSVGRGRLKGVSAVLTYGENTWTIHQGENDTLAVDGDRKMLDSFLTAFNRGNEE